jgi:pilus assembly protein CpaF
MTTPAEASQRERAVDAAVHALRGRYRPEELDRMAPDALRRVISAALPAQTAPALLDEIAARLSGLGLLEPLLADPAITDIMVNGTSAIFVERDGRLEELPLRFRDEVELLDVISRIVRYAGREIDPAAPMVDARLPSGARANAILPPLAVDGPMLSIRRPRFGVVRGADLVASGMMPREWWEFFSLAVRARLSVLVTGGTGAGKTTLLNALGAEIPAAERVVTIEDAAELTLPQKNVVRLETKPGVNGRGEVSSRDLFRNSLRMRPDRIIVGEVRGAEVLDMLQAMNSGHEGSMTSLHANSPRDALLRVDTLLRLSGVALSEEALAQSLSRAFQLVVHLARLQDGRRVVLSVQEIVGRDAGVVSMQELFAFTARGVDEAGRVVGAFRATGARPQFYERLLRASGAP